MGIHLNRGAGNVCLAVCMVFATFLGFTPMARAQSYPTKPIRIVVPFPAGGTSDILARAIGQRLTEEWKQPALVDTLNAAVVRIVKDPATTRFLRDQGAEPHTMSPAEYAAYLKSEVVKWAQAVNLSGAKID